MDKWVNAIGISTIATAAISVGYDMKNKAILLAINIIFIMINIIMFNYKENKEKNKENEKLKTQVEIIDKLDNSIKEIVSVQEKIVKVNIDILDILQERMLKAIKNKGIEEGILEANNEIISKLGDIDNSIQEGKIKNEIEDANGSLEDIHEILKNELVEKLEKMIKDISEENREINKEIIDRFIDLGAIEEKNIKLLKDSYAILNSQIEVQHGL